MHISRIRSKFGDSKGNRFIREKYDLSIFSEECREYDEHLKIHLEDSVRKYPRYELLWHMVTQGGMEGYSVVGHLCCIVVA